MPFGIACRACRAFGFVVNQGANICFVNSMLFSYIIKRGYTYLLFENRHFTIEIGFKGSLEPPLHRVYQPLNQSNPRDVKRKERKTHLWMSINHNLGLTLQSASTALSSKPTKTTLPWIRQSPCPSFGSQAPKLQASHQFPWRSTP